MMSCGLERSLQNAFTLASDLLHEYVNLEHLLLAFTEDDEVISVLSGCNVSLPSLRKRVLLFLKGSDIFGTLRYKDYKPQPTLGLQRVVQRAQSHTNIAGIRQISSINVLIEMFSEQDSHSLLFLLENNISILDLVPYVTRNSKSFKARTEIGAPDAIKTSEISVLDEYCINLNELALKGKIDRLVIREKEVNRTINILLRRGKNNPLYVGEPGVGKTAIVEGLAHAIVSGNIPDKLKDIQIYALKIGSLLAGTRYRGDFEERIKLVLNEIASNQNIVLFIDEIHTIVGAGATSSGSIDAGNLLKPFLTKGPLRCIGATTYREYFTYFEKDAALSRRFQRVDVAEPDKKDTIKILNGIKSYYEDFHNVEYTNASINEIVMLAKRYISGKVFPDKAIDIMDELGATCNGTSTFPHTKAGKKPKIGVKRVRETFSKTLSIPMDQLNSNIEKKLQLLAEKLKSHIFDQDEIIDKVVSTLRVGLLSLKEGRPIGNYLFAGSTGVGKTELAKKIAENLSMQFVSIDMSEYTENHSISKLIGAPPGYVGFEKGGLLTEMLLKNQHSVVLFDEIEKSHSEVQNILLQIMDSGIVTDSTGKKVSFENAIIILTTNVCTNHFVPGGIGFTMSGNKENLEERFSKFFASELLNRLDLILNFNKLSVSAIEKIIIKTISNIKNKLQEKGIKLEVEKDVINYFLDEHSSKKAGARSVENFVKDVIMNAVSPKIFKAERTGLKLVLNSKRVDCIC